MYYDLSNDIYDWFMVSVGTNHIPTISLKNDYFSHIHFEFFWEYSITYKLIILYKNYHISSKNYFPQK